jgi:hypothetical protein
VNGNAKKEGGEELQAAFPTMPSENRTRTINFSINLQMLREGQHFSHFRSSGSKVGPGSEARQNYELPRTGS